MIRIIFLVRPTVHMVEMHFITGFLPSSSNDMVINNLKLQ